MTMFLSVGQISGTSPLYCVCQLVRCDGVLGSARLRGCGVVPESRLDPELEDRLDEDAEVVCDDFAQNLIGLGGEGLGADGRPELCFDHGEGGFDV